MLWIQSSPAADYGALLAENQALQAEVAALQETKNVLEEISGARDVIPAAVYSRYPLNFKSQILINVGEGVGILVGQAAILPENILIGRVREVFPDSASVQTVFDPGFQAAVRVGDKGIEALLIGGGEPKVTLIPKDAEVRMGDVVYVADSGFPYGLAVGEVEGISLKEEELLGEATLRFAYDLNRLHAVLLIR